MAGGKFAGGDGSVPNPFLIEDAHDFNAIRAYPTRHFQLIKDINLNVPPYNTGAGWIPVPFFSGQIDGQGHKVSSLRVWSKGSDVGLFLESGRNFQITNTHFDDIYMELISEDDRGKKFTFFGIGVSNSGSLSFTSVNGCSFQGKLKIESPNVTARLMAYNVYNSHNSFAGGGTVSCAMNDLYFDLENLGSTRINVLGYSSAARHSANITLNRGVFKHKGAFAQHQAGSNGRLISNSAYAIDDIDTEYTNFPNVLLQTPEFLSKSENLPGFVDVSYLGRQVWYFPGTTHVRMADYSQNRFLIEARGNLFSHSLESGLRQVGKVPVVINTLIEHGIDYLESIPANVWGRLKQDYGNVTIHTYTMRALGKSLEANKEKLSFAQEIGDKVIMRTPIDFSHHNDDIYKIQIVKTNKTNNKEQAV